MTKQVMFAIPLIGAIATHIIHILYEYGIHTIGNEQQQQQQKKKNGVFKRYKSAAIVTVNVRAIPFFFIYILVWYILFSRYEILY